MLLRGKVSPKIIYIYNFAVLFFSLSSSCKWFQSRSRKTADKMNKHNLAPQIKGTSVYLWSEPGVQNQEERFLPFPPCRRRTAKETNGPEEEEEKLPWHHFGPPQPGRWPENKLPFFSSRTLSSSSSSSDHLL